MTTTANHLPDLCVQEGLDCTVCTSSTARELARACPGLPHKLVTQLFVQIHTHPACARMHGNFAQAYAEALSERKPAMCAIPKVAAAAAA